MKFGSPIATPSQQFTPGQYDTLLSTTSIGASSTVSLTTPPCLNTYKQLLVHVHFPSSGPANPGAVWAQVQGPLTSLPTFSGAFPAQPTVAALQLSDVETIIGCINNVGDQLNITVVFTAVPLANTLISVIGLTNPIPQLLRGDGRNYPLGVFSLLGSLAGTNGPSAIYTPPANSRVLIKNLEMDNETANTQIQIVSSISGIVASSIMDMRGTGVVTLNDQSGILCDPGIAVSVQGAGNPTGLCMIHFDVVPA